MGILSPSFLLGSVVIFYLVSFVVFAILRIITGISIQRIGYCSLRHIAFTLRDGVRLEIRGLGFTPHRPTFAQPTWVSLRLTELKIIIDPRTLSARTTGVVEGQGTANGSLHSNITGSTSPKSALRLPRNDSGRSRTWKRLTRMKEKLKELHKKIHWLCLVDVVALDSSCVILEVGKFEIGSFHLAVDTRRKTVDRGRLFQHKRLPKADQRPAEWMLTVRGVLFTPERKESLEVLDICSVNVHGLLYKELAGLRDASISIKLGRIHIPYDDLIECQQRIEQLRQNQIYADPQSPDEEITFTDVIQELDRPGSREAKIVQAVSDSKEFASSILRGIQEIQLAISFVGMSKRIQVSPENSPLYLNIAMNEIGVDMHRLDPKSPAHRMYFSSRDIAHQALLAAISIAVSLDDEDGKPERILYLPMATTTVKTTLPSKTVAFSEDKDAAERNTNMLFANFVLTSPSIDVDPKHLSIIFAIIQSSQMSRSTRFPRSDNHHHHLLSRLLPKASIKLSIHEPVIRVALPPADPSLKLTDEFDLLICCVSSIALESDSSHSAAGELHYLLLSQLRVASHQLYYQTAAGERYNLSVADALELKVQVTASPNVAVTASGNLQTLSLHMVRPEISDGVRQIIQQVRRKSHIGPAKHAGDVERRNFLRRIPPWLINFQLQGSNFGVEVAGVDSAISKNIRGVALQLESWTAEYKAQKDAPSERPPSRRRRMSKTGAGGEPSIKVTPPSDTAILKSTSTDGRRLAVHVRGFEGFVVEALDTLEPEPFIRLPRFEVAFSTSNDGRGPIFHLNSHIKSLYLQYSLYRYYALGVAVMVLKQAFDHRIHPSETASDSPAPSPDLAAQGQAVEAPELLTVDLKAGLFQLKLTMPSDPPLMLHVYATEAGRHRWSAPFMKSRLLRLYAGAAKMSAAWARIVTVKGLRVDPRQFRRKHGAAFVDEKSIDIGTDFIRVGVPHQLVLHKIFDNLANVIKATQQLHHRFRTGTNEYILKKRPEQAKEVPKVSVRSKALLFEIEDGPFEWKLGSIYRIGLIEQKQRLAREEAFVAKAKNLDQARRRKSSTRYRTQSEHTLHRDKSAQSQRKGTRSRSGSPRAPSRQRHSRPESTPRGRKMRYDPGGKCGLTGCASITTDEAWERLQRYNARSWKKRIDAGYRIQNSGMREIRSMFSGHDDHIDNDSGNERILAIPERPGLLSALISDLYIVIDKPSFPLWDYPSFLHRIGKGMPRDMEYTLLIPMSIQVDMGEARFTLRDYPLPILHVPAIRPGQSPRLPSWLLKTDFVIAEEYRGDVSIKQVPIQIVPPERCSEPVYEKGFAIEVGRTVSPVKTYSDVQIAINTSAPTSITWGTSYQPAIQDMMMVIEGFSKPQVDPSERVGFWDKIRLSVHSRITVAWKGDGDVHLKLKGTASVAIRRAILTRLPGSRDPYMVTGYGAGFVMCWRNGVRWDIHQDDDPKQFMTVTSGDYLLAIPDYSHQAREYSARATVDSESVSSRDSYRSGAMFKKVVMKLSGNVQWLAGLVFERDLADGARSFDFAPHFGVTLTTPDRARASRGKYDAFRGFRSNHIHMSLAVHAPKDRDWTLTNDQPSTNYNTVHLTPRFFTHFLSWWSMFSGVMSLPIRQGKLFPGIEKTSKKFGRHLATFKYKVLLSPLFLAHVYKHKDAEDYSEDLVSATGLKLRLSSFILDLHQRREEFAAQGQGRNKQMKTSGMRINQAQLDFDSADLRAVSASIAGTTAEDVRKADNEELAAYQEPIGSADLSKFNIPDLDLSWVDMDDFVELDWILPAETNPETKIMPLAYSPRFTYFRQTDRHGSVSGDPTRSSSFGNEGTHYCVMSQDNDPRRVQCNLIKDRIAKIDEQLETHQRRLGEQELRVVRDGFRDGSLKERFDALKYQGRALESKKQHLQNMFDRLTDRIEQNRPWTASNGDTAAEDMMTTDMSDDPKGHGMTDGAAPSPASFVDDFNNRFIVHNMQLKWNNSLRNIILRYVHQVGQRRGFIYYMSRTAVKFILDIVEEQHKSKQRRQENSEQPTPTSEAPPAPSFDEDREEDPDVQDRIQNLLKDAKKFVNADDPKPSSMSRSDTGNLNKDVSKDYTPLNSYHVRLIAPQIQMQSEKNSKSVLLVTAKGMQLKVIQIMDKNRMMDEVSGLVQRRFSVDMDDVQFFVTTQKIMNQYLHLYSGNRYGTPKGSAWPPWVPFEVNFDFEFDPFGFSRVVQRTSASLRYDKYNTLRLKYNDEVNVGKHGGHSSPATAENRIDHIWVEFPHIRAICDSAQYYTMYVIVLDLLLYSEPLEKVRSERLEKIMLASDFSDLRGAPEMVIRLQDRIRQLEEIKTHFQIHAKYLDRQGWQDRLSIEHDLTSCEDELFFLMKAITTSQRKNDDRAQATQTNGLLRWYLSASEIVWHLMREQNEPLMEIQLQHALYDRTDNSDGSNHNSMEIERMRGLNLLPHALYPEMLAPYSQNGKRFEEGQSLKMLSVQWHMLEAIAGIPVLDQFEVNLFPLKVQLEREIGKKIFEYIFPGVGNANGGPGSFSPFLTTQSPVQEDENDSDQNSVSDITASVPSAAASSEDPIRDRPASVEMRLRPTKAFGDVQGAAGFHRPGKPMNGILKKDGAPHHFGLFQHPNPSQQSARHALQSKKSSKESLGPSHDASSTSLAAMNASAEKHKRFGGLKRSNTGATSHNPAEKEKASDDLTQMMSRASNYMTLAYVKIPSVVLCLSYKGRGERNIEDVHDFVFRMPVLEYRNKTWSNLDLALRLKKDVIKALISHTGAIIGNKFHHRPTKQQQTRLREIANSSLLLPNATSPGNVTGSEASSVRGRSRSPRSSDLSRDSKLTRSGSWSSSLQSSAAASSSNMYDSTHSTPKAEPAKPSEPPVSMRQAFTRRFTGDFRSKEPGTGTTNGSAGSGGGAVDEEEITKRKSVMLFGKKILGGLNDR
ncbi:MAG: hypothetical protein LQ348_001457 [Seirophora lacunosa]|nr:MAG: hypothetical protein LQ348_001457 [Seirophora lacunosa]